MALRILMNIGAKAVDNLSTSIIELVLRVPLPSDESAQNVTSSMIDDPHLYHSEAFLGRGDYTFRYIHEASAASPAIRRLFASSEDYAAGLSTLLFIAGILYLARHNTAQYPIYPGFKLIGGSRQLITRSLTRMASRPEVVARLAAMASESVLEFRTNWRDRMNRLNQAELGGRYWPRGDWEIDVEF